MTAAVRSMRAWPAVKERVHFGLFGAIAVVVGAESLAQAAWIARLQRRRGAQVFRLGEDFYLAH